MRRRDFLLAGAATGAALTLGFPAFAATKLRFAHFSVIDDPNHVSAVEFADGVAAETAGDTTVEIIPNSQLGGEVDVVEGILLGTIDISAPGCAVLANWVPEMNALNMPFAFSDWDHYTKTLDGPLFDAMVAAAAAKNIRILGFMTSGVRHVMSKTAINSIDDLAGMRIRTVQNPVHIATFQAFGASPTPIAYNEVYSSLQTGVVDGADAANTNYYTQKFYEVAPFWAQLGWLYYSNAIVMAEDKFQAMTPEQQAALVKIGRQNGINHMGRWAESDAATLGKLVEAGVTVTTPDTAPFRERSKSIYTEFLKTDDEKKLFAIIQAG
jgi:tripartite ATP-independent transporter DctP family solute receptor